MWSEPPSEDSYLPVRASEARILTILYDIEDVYICHVLLSSSCHRPLYRPPVRYRPASWCPGKSPLCCGRPFGDLSRVKDERVKPSCTPSFYLLEIYKSNHVGSLHLSLPSCHVPPCRQSSQRRCCPCSCGCGTQESCCCSVFSGHQRCIERPPRSRSRHCERRERLQQQLCRLPPGTLPA